MQRVHRYAFFPLARSRLMNHKSIGFYPRVYTASIILAAAAAEPPLNYQKSRFDGPSRKRKREREKPVGRDKSRRADKSFFACCSHIPEEAGVLSEAASSSSISTCMHAFVRRWHLRLPRRRAYVYICKEGDCCLSRGSR